jgi:hypothetical protein
MRGCARRISMTLALGAALVGPEALRAPAGEAGGNALRLVARGTGDASRFQGEDLPQSSFRRSSRPQPDR